MAINMYTIHTCKVGVLVDANSAPGQTTWGTAEADSNDAVELNARVAELTEDVQLREADSALIGTRSDDVVNHQSDVKGAAPTFELVTPDSQGVLKDELAFRLYAHYQYVVEAAGTPFLKTFKFPAMMAQVDFTDDDGWFGSFIFKSPETSQSLKVADCIGCAKLGFNIPPNGYLQCSQTFHGRGAVIATSSPSGTWTRKTLTASDRFHYNDMTLTIDFGSGSRTIVCVGDVSWETTQEMTKIGMSSGDFLTWVLGMRKGAFNIRMLYDIYAREAEANWRNGTVSTVNIYWGTGASTTDGDLKFTFPIKIKDCKRVSGDSGVYAVDMSAVIVGDIATPTDMMRVELVDTQDMMW